MQSKTKIEFEEYWLKVKTVVTSKIKEHSPDPKEMSPFVSTFNTLEEMIVEQAVKLSTEESKI